MVMLLKLLVPLPEMEDIPLNEIVPLFPLKVPSFTKLPATPKVPELTPLRVLPETILMLLKLDCEVPDNVAVVAPSNLTVPLL